MELDMPTNFAESNALLFIQSSQEDRAEECLQDFSRIELLVLAKAAQRLESMCDRMACDGRS